jgi:hypothetical protein
MADVPHLEARVDGSNDPVYAGDRTPVKAEIALQADKRFLHKVL